MTTTLPAENVDALRLSLLCSALHDLADLLTHEPLRRQLRRQAQQVHAVRELVLNGTYDHDLATAWLDAGHRILTDWKAPR